LKKLKQEDVWKEENEEEEEEEEEESQQGHGDFDAFIQWIRVAVGLPSTEREPEKGKGKSSKKKPQKKESSNFRKKLAADNGLSDKANYTLALLNDGTLLVSKVNGMPQGNKTLSKQADSRGFKNVVFVGKFGPSSAHAEMCILHHVGRNKLRSIVKMACIETNCAYCSATLTHYRCNTTSTAFPAGQQSGWSHPFYTLSYGSQLGKGEQEQLEELDAVHSAENNNQNNNETTLLEVITKVAEIGNVGGYGKVKVRN
jgi:hypothetical protein